MSDIISKISTQVIFHYQRLSDISKYMDILRVEKINFEMIRLPILINDYVQPRNDSEINDMSEVIARDLVTYEFSHFLQSLKNVECNTIETKLEHLVETLDKTFDDLWDSSFNLEHIYMSPNLRDEIRQRKESVAGRISFSTKNLIPVPSIEFQNEIIFASRHNFGKSYPKTIEDQILISMREDMMKTYIDCKIVQRLDFRNMNSMAKVIVTDIEK